MAGELGSALAGWRTVPLESVMEAIIDYRGKSPTKTTSGIPLITAKIVKGGRILPPEEFIAAKDFDEWMRRGLPHPGDVLVTTEAPLGEVAQLDHRKVALAQRIIALRGKPDVLDNAFLKFLLQSESVQTAMKARSTGTTVFGIRQSELRQVPLMLPPLSEQQSIARILGSMDDKIEVNRKMNETLEAMARALFKSWFVDFDPVRAKAEGRDTGLPAHIANLFPGSFEDSELGEIPAGWTPGCLGEVADNPRRTVSANEIADGTPYIALEHMPRECISLSDWDNADGVESSKFAFKKREILFGKLRPYFHKVGVAPIDGLCSTDILVITPKAPEWFGFILEHTSSREFVQHTNAGSTGTKMPRTNWADMSRYRLPIPPAPLARAFTDIVHPMMDHVVASVHESRLLAEMRDGLLPKLISGQVRVKVTAQLAEVTT